MKSNYIFTGWIIVWMIMFGYACHAMYSDYKCHKELLAIERVKYGTSNTASFPISAAIGAYVTSSATPKQDGFENWTLCYAQVDDTTGSLLILGVHPCLEVWVQTEQGGRRRVKVRWDE